MPLLAFPTAALAGPLLLRKQGSDDYGADLEVNGKRLVVGRIMRVARSSGRVAWFWTVTGPAAGDAGIGLVGETEDLDTAKAAVRQAFDRLLHWADMAKDGELGWHVGAERVSQP
jgi:hypothetical protein